MAASLKQLLKVQPDGWTIRIWLRGKSHDGVIEFVEWLSIDRYQIREYLGRTSSERFDNVADFEARYWLDSPAG